MCHPLVEFLISKSVSKTVALALSILSELLTSLVKPRANPDGHWCDYVAQLTAELLLCKRTDAEGGNPRMPGIQLIITWLHQGRDSRQMLWSQLPFISSPKAHARESAHWGMTKSLAQHRTDLEARPETPSLHLFGQVCEMSASSEEHSALWGELLLGAEDRKGPKWGKNSKNAGNAVNICSSKAILVAS